MCEVLGPIQAARARDFTLSRAEALTPRDKIDKLQNKSLLDVFTHVIKLWGGV